MTVIENAELAETADKNLAAARALLPPCPASQDSSHDLTGGLKTGLSTVLEEVNLAEAQTLEDGLPGQKKREQKPRWADMASEELSSPIDLGSPVIDLGSPVIDLVDLGSPGDEPTLQASRVALKRHSEELSVDPCAPPGVWPTATRLPGHPPGTFIAPQAKRVRQDADEDGASQSASTPQQVHASGHSAPTEAELEKRLEQRKKSVLIIKNSEGYKKFRQRHPKDSAPAEAPRTPDPLDPELAAVRKWKWTVSVWDRDLKNWVQ